MMDERIGHYKIIGELGRGGMGVVYKAHEESLNRFVAIKVLGEHLAQDPAYVARFLREAQSVARLTHPNIVQIHFVGVDKGRHYFVLEFVTGASLQQKLKVEPQMSAHDAGQLVLQAATGLSAAHDEGVIHRDIKPANLLIDERGRLKIADFGLSLMREAISRLTATGIVMGTPGYLAPEQCMDVEIDHRTDIYSLGVTYYEMLAGRMPFEASSPLALLRMILDVEPPNLQELNPNVDNGTRAILVRMMAKKREERYSSCHELIVDLKAHLDRFSATSMNREDSPTNQIAASPVASPLPSAPQEFDQGFTMGATPTKVLPPAQRQQAPVPPPSAPPSLAGIAAPPSAPPVKIVSAESPVSVQPMPAPVNKSSNAAVIAIVAVVGIMIGFGLFAGAMWLLKRGERVASLSEQPSPVVMTEVPEVSDVSDVAIVEQASPVVKEVETVKNEPIPILVQPTPVPVATRVMAAATPETPKARPTQAPTAIWVAVAQAEPTHTPPETKVDRIEVPEAAEAKKVDAVMMQYLDELQSGDFVKERKAAKLLYRDYRNDPAILDTVSKVLLDGFRRDLKDGNHVDAMAWLCNILGASGDRRYASTLRTVLKQGKGRKIKGYAKKNLNLLK